jgi:hypothetical protein
MPEMHRQAGRSAPIRRLARKEGDMSLNYPPDVTGNEYQIGGPRSEWEAVETCPSCEWTGAMRHEEHPSFGVMAWCANPEPIEEDADDAGRPFNVYCRNREDGFEIEPDEPNRYDFDE